MTYWPSVFFGIAIALTISSEAPAIYSKELDLLNLTDVRVSNSWQFRDAEYRFDISIPGSATAPLQKVVFSQIEGADYPNYSVRKTFAYEGGDRNQKLPLGSVTNDSDERTMTVTFDPPVQPGREITVVLNSFRNPRDGTYIYRVVGFPPGENRGGQRLGIGRLQFYEPIQRRR
ncbi:MAG: DUF2808 domain-containing protein [Phormidesmis sp.]